MIYHVPKGTNVILSSRSYQAFLLQYDEHLNIKPFTTTKDVYFEESDLLHKPYSYYTNGLSEHIKNYWVFQLPPNNDKNAKILLIHENKQGTEPVILLPETVRGIPRNPPTQPQKSLFSHEEAESRISKAIEQQVYQDHEMFRQISSQMQQRAQSWQEQEYYSWAIQNIKQSRPDTFPGIQEMYEDQQRSIQDRVVSQKTRESLTPEKAPPETFWQSIKRRYVKK